MHQNTGPHIPHTAKIWPEDSCKTKQMLDYTQNKELPRITNSSFPSSIMKCFANYMLQLDKTQCIREKGILKLV